MRRSDDVSGRGKDLAGPSPSAAGSDRRLDAVIPFPSRRATPPLRSAAGGDPPSSPASFEPLGSIVRAVVLRLQDDRVRLNVLVPGTLGNGGKPGTSDDGSLGG